MTKVGKKIYLTFTQDGINVILTRKDARDIAREARGFVVECPVSPHQAKAIGKVLDTLESVDL